jgi:hypothetical protein
VVEQSLAPLPLTGCGLMEPLPHNTSHTASLETSPVNQQNWMRNAETDPPKKTSMVL